MKLPRSCLQSICAGNRKVVSPAACRFVHRPHSRTGPTWENGQQQVNTVHFYGRLFVCCLFVCVLLVFSFGLSRWVGRERGVWDLRDIREEETCSKCTIWKKLNTNKLIKRERYMVLGRWLSPQGEDLGLDDKNIDEVRCGMHTYHLGVPIGRREAETGEAPRVHRPASLVSITANNCLRSVSSMVHGEH